MHNSSTNTRILVPALLVASLVGTSCLDETEAPSSFGAISQEAKRAGLPKVSSISIKKGVFGEARLSPDGKLAMPGMKEQMELFLPGSSREWEFNFDCYETELGMVCMEPDEDLMLWCDYKPDGASCNGTCIDCE